MPDGVRLAATIYRPDPDLGPQPCLVEALPYRKDDVYSSNAPEYERLRDQYGYAVCRIDVRGTGSSGGRATDEYPVTERGDLTAAVAWLAQQAWCTGDIGMYGTSYSGCAALLTALSAHRRSRRSSRFKVPTIRTPMTSTTAAAHCSSATSWTTRAT